MATIVVGNANKLRVITLAACLMAMACASTGPRREVGASGLINVGVAQIDITPDDPIRLTGYGNRTMPSERVGQRLRAKALAFGGDGGRPAVLIAADLVGVPWQITEELARRLQKAGVASGQLAVSVTHTHTGPSIAGVLPFIFTAPVTAGEQIFIDRYSADLVNKLERVALAALADRRPSRVTWGQGTASFAANRRVLKDGRWMAFGV